MFLLFHKEHARVQTHVPGIMAVGYTERRLLVRENTTVDGAFFEDS